MKQLGHLLFGLSLLLVSKMSFGEESRVMDDIEKRLKGIEVQVSKIKEQNPTRSIASSTGEKLNYEKEFSHIFDQPFQYDFE